MTETAATRCYLEEADAKARGRSTKWYVHRLLGENVYYTPACSHRSRAKDRINNPTRLVGESTFTDMTPNPKLRPSYGNPTRDTHYTTHDCADPYCLHPLLGGRRKLHEQHGCGTQSKRTENKNRNAKHKKEKEKNPNPQPKT